MPKPRPTDIPSFAATQLTLLDAELQAELSETNALLSSHTPSTLSRAGLAILNLNIASIRTGLGGKTVLELALDPAVVTKGEKADIPEHGIRVGDIVAVQEQPSGSAKKTEKRDLAKKGVEGVVLRVRRENVEIVLDKEDAEVPGGGKLWIVKLANDVTYKRMNQTMTRLQKFSEQEHTPFMHVLFGQASPSPLPSDLNDPSNPLHKLEWNDPSLNDSQKEAIRFALASREIALIHGPPGTGKTHTLIELIRQMLKQNLRLLVCGPSNISVDNIVERLAAYKVPMIRLGHPARLLPSVLNHSLDVLTRTSEAAALVQDIRKEMDDKQSSIRKTRNAKERRGIYGELKELRKEFRERERGCVDNLVKGSKVVLATLHGAGGFHLKNQEFDVVIVDEASQALEAQCWVPLLWVKASKLVLAGDHLQLPPTIKSLNSSATKAIKKETRNRNAEMGKSKDTHTTLNIPTTLETTLFDRLLALHGPSIKRMLTTQYRMHNLIMQFPSTELYDSKLIAAPSVAARLLTDLPYETKETEDTREPLVFWDTQGGDFGEKVEDEDEGLGKGKGKAGLLGDSKSNEAEAALVKMHVGKLVAAGVRPEDIAVVTPYNAQLAILSAPLKEAFPGIELGSVDGFQGREKEAVVVSLVRSNAQHEVGFLGEKRRLNVAMTRPKRHLCIIGDSETVGRYVVSISLSLPIYELSEYSSPTSMPTRAHITFILFFPSGTSVACDALCSVGKPFIFLLVQAGLMLFPLRDACMMSAFCTLFGPLAWALRGTCRCHGLT
ncbi:P-loop containing nucleoside triphosphate hydrolase protein [Amniculicola lignicola CBS 123094]|uniref:DNA helicase n=1 Tax=Amniculicola lignicola CBS 123094 TaxID=1392246 RepID=A0A6A5WX57_9PLEO|nr:P-loop containing nucleoside triphosphate hydrolase protein [Amniculicola lignicola CBS 123094]